MPLYFEFNYPLPIIITSKSHRNEGEMFRFFGMYLIDIFASA